MSAPLASAALNTKIFEEEFGDPKPIPPGTYRCSPYVQEAARMYIHDGKKITEIVEILELTPNQSDNVYKIKQRHKWDRFMGRLSAAIRPSMLLAIEPHNMDRIDRERTRRARVLPKYEAEEERLVAMLSAQDPTSKSYELITKALEKIRETIARYTNVDNYESEMSQARSAVIKAGLNPRGGDKRVPGGGQRSAHLIELD